MPSKPTQSPKSDELAAMLIHEDSIISFRKYIKRSLKLCRKLERKLAAARESEASETRWAAQYKAERDEVRDQLYRIAKEGFGLEDTIGGEACVDYVLRRLGKSPENAEASRSAGDNTPPKQRMNTTLKNEQAADSGSAALIGSALQDTPTPITDLVEHACNRKPLVLGFLQMRDHAKELERQLKQTKDALHAAHKDRMADAKTRRGNHSVEVTDMVRKCKWWGCENPADSMFLDGSDGMREIHVCSIHREKLFPRPSLPNADGDGRRDGGPTSPPTSSPFHPPSC